MTDLNPSIGTGLQGKRGFFSKIVLNPMDPASILRSKRFQGALLVGLALGCQLSGVELDSIVDVTNDTVTKLGTVWGLVGALLAQTSPRPF